MSTTLTTLEKLTQTSACAPWPTLTGAQFPLLAFGDVDGDGCDEPLLLVPDPTGMLPPALGVLSLFDYTTINENWAGTTPTQQLIGTGYFGVQQAVPVNPPQYADNALNVQLCYAPIVTEGVDSILVYSNSASAPSLTVWQWQAYKGYQASTQNASISAASSGGSTWSIGSGQTYLTSDIDGDGIAEVVGYNGSSIGTLQWSGSKTGGELICLNSQDTFEQANGGDSSAFSNSTSFWLADINGDGKAELLMLTSSAELIVLSWIKGAWVAIGQGMVNAPGMNSSSYADTFSLCSTQIVFADLDGDGTQELIILAGVKETTTSLFSPTTSYTSYVGVMNWSDSALNTVGSWVSQLAGSEQTWNLEFSQNIYAGVFTSNGTPQISIFDPTIGVGLLSWTAEAGFSLEAFVGQGIALSASTGATAWTISSDNQLSFADIDGDGVLELLVASNSGIITSRTVIEWDGIPEQISTDIAAVGVLKWSSGALTTLAMTVPDTAGPAPCQTWGMSLLYNAPANPFIAFTGDQLTIYNNLSTGYISANQPDGIDPAVELGIRTAYTLSEDAGTFSSWQQQIKDNRPGGKGTWNWTRDFSSSDIDAVFKTIIGELINVEFLMGVVGTATTMVTQLASQRTTDIGTVLSNLNITDSSQQNSTQVDYWPGQIAVGVLWGVAAAGGILDPAVGVGLSVLASLMGSLLAAPQNTPGAILPATLDTVEYGSMVEDSSQYVTSLYNGIGDQFGVILQDYVKMNVMTPLFQNAWAISYINDSEGISQTSNYTRLHYYQMLMPSLFQWTQWAMTTATQPWTAQYSGGSFVQSPVLVDNTAPFFAVTPAGITPLYANNNINNNLPILVQVSGNSFFMLLQLGTSFPNPGYPNAALITDLFTKLTLNPTDLVYAQRGWQLTGNLYTIGDSVGNTPADSGYFYFLNYTDEPLWYTLYSGAGFGSGKLEAGLVASNTLGSTQSSYLIGNFASGAYIRGQGNGGADGSPNTTMDIPAGATLQINSATTAVGSWFVFFMANSDTSAWWGCLNSPS